MVQLEDRGKQRECVCERERGREKGKEDEHGGEVLSAQANPRSQMEWLESSVIIGGLRVEPAIGKE